ncbi:hypothetical protein VdG1_00114 [Verticillium dahliae VDG1]|nr:hypothetical protein VdG1_00114 [Verticillium dahliae VDG1]
MHIRRPLLALYRPFALGSVDAPAQITRAYLTSSMVILQYLDELDPMLAHYQSTCMRATNTNPELVHPPLPHPPPPLSINNNHPYLQAQVPGQQPPHYMLHPNAMAAAPTQDEETMIWDLEGLDPSWNLYWDQIMPLWSS